MIPTTHVAGTMTKKRQRRSADFTFRVALAALKEPKTLSQLASEYAVHPTQITQGKQQLLEAGRTRFGQQRPRAGRLDHPRSRTL